MVRRVPSDTSLRQAAGVPEDVKPLTVEQGPQPGEVWICTERSFVTTNYAGSPCQDRIWISDRHPFIVLYISQAQIGVVMAGTDGPDPKVVELARGQWNWHEHMTRVWPAVPSWHELHANGVKPPVLAADDLRSQ